MSTTNSNAAPASTSSQVNVMWVTKCVAVTANQAEKIKASSIVRMMKLCDLGDDANAVPQLKTKTYVNLASAIKAEMVEHADLEKINGIKVDRSDYVHRVGSHCIKPSTLTVLADSDDELFYTEETAKSMRQGACLRKDNNHVQKGTLDELCGMHGLYCQKCGDINQAEQKKLHKICMEALRGDHEDVFIEAIAQETIIDSNCNDDDGMGDDSDYDHTSSGYDDDEMEDDLEVTKENPRSAFSPNDAIKFSPVDFWSSSPYSSFGSPGGGSLYIGSPPEFTSAAAFSRVHWADSVSPVEKPMGPCDRFERKRHRERTQRKCGLEACKAAKNARHYY